MTMADGVEEELHVRGILTFLILNLGQKSSEVFEDNTGETVFAEKLELVQ